MATDRYAAIADVFRELVGMVFEGTLHHEEYVNPQTDTVRCMVDVETPDAAAAIQKTRESLQNLGHFGVWKGWTDSKDSYMGYKWPVRIFARRVIKSELERRGNRYMISNIIVFPMSPSTTRYNAGVEFYLTAVSPETELFTPCIQPKVLLLG